MSPLDEELHDALHLRAASLTPPPDPMAGIERRAAGIRRRRLVASLTGGALVIAAAAVAVPSLLPGGPTTKLIPATQGPSTSGAALDPAHPWALRGTQPDAGGLADLRSQWSAQHPGSTLTPLYSHVYELTRQTEVVFVASGGGAPRYGSAWLRNDVGRGGVAVDRELPSPATALVLRLPGDEVQRLLVVAAPDSRAVEFAGDGRSFQAMTSPADAPGVGIAPFEGDLSAPRVRVTGADGSTVYDQPVVTDEGQPSNVLTSWPTRGATETTLLPAAKAAWAPSLGTTADQIQVKVLFTGDTDSGVKFVMGQAWAPGAAAAHNVSYAEGGSNGPQPFIGGETPMTPAVLAFVIDSLPGTTTDLLVVVPQPRTGQVLYDDDATGAFRPITGQDQLNGVVLIDRSKTATSDRLELLDGNGNLDAPTYKGPVAPLLCGLKECG